MSSYLTNGHNLSTLYSPPYDVTGRVILGRSYPGEPSRPRMSQNGRAFQYAPVPKKAAVDWGSFIAGAVTGGIIILFLATATGRGILCAAGGKVKRKLSK